MAPASSAAVTRSSSMKLVSATTSTSGQRGLDLGGGRDPVHHRHQEVHEHDVGLELRDELDGAPPVLGLADDLDVVEELEEPVQAAPDDRVVVDQQHP